MPNGSYRAECKSRPCVNRLTDRGKKPRFLYNLTFDMEQGIVMIELNCPECNSVQVDRYPIPSPTTTTS
ncbi:MAG: hypothetical protein XU15_C0011G0121 [candidate division NC10 bacterium CSP1-5]|nr:MAG: hypothetical protein XU15_C0011G0121 [candidate division NC10 bacterium CSP1-5]